MRRIFLFFVLVPILLSLETFSLKNGMKLILVQRDIPAVFMATYYRAGSFFDPPGQEGLAYLSSRLSFVSRRKTRPWEQIFFLKRVGGEINVEVNQDFSVFFSYFPKEEFPLALWYEMERMKPPLVSRERFEMTKAQLSQELFEQMTGNPWLAIYSEILRGVYGETPYSHPPWGYPGNIKRISGESFLRFYSSYYQPGMATMIIIGNLTEADRSLIIKMFSPLKGKNVFIPERVDFPARDFSGNISVKGFEKPGFVLSYRISNPGCRERVILEMLKSYLERRLIENMERYSPEEKIKIVTSHFIYSSLFSVMYKGKDFMKIKRLIEDEITKLRVSSIKGENLYGLQRDFIRRIREAEQNPEKWREELGILSLVYRCSEADVLSRTLSINTNSFRELVRSNLTPFNRATLYLKPWKEK
ncbi:MAG: insulinase family protein [Candidatus Aminicenantes bacterium]|nr:insulinase family protein [Candidatus Aminicenantes bacterium]